MLIGALSQYFFGFTIFVLSTFLVLLVLVQRGRGGGLTGALGGPGGQSAFGTKAGDLFTRITVGVATAWIILCATSVFMLRNRGLPETGKSDRATTSSSNMGADTGTGASSGTTGTGESSSAFKDLDLSKFDLSKTALPEGTALAPGGSATTPPATDAATPAAPAVTPPAADATTPAAPTGTDAPPAPQ